MRSAAALLFALALAFSAAVPHARGATAAPQTRGATAAPLTRGTTTAPLTRGATASAERQSDKLPPISYTCPMHPEILEDKKGTCPICKMDLVPIRLDSVWTCGTKPLAIVKDAPGRCPIDGSALVQVTAAVSWTCPGGTDESTSPGTCADGSAKAKTYALRAHGNHNPQHGGLFFMASDNTHHLEGAYLSNGAFRMYFYDEFTKPQTLAVMRNYKATLMVKDPNTGKETPYSL